MSNRILINVYLEDRITGTKDLKYSYVIVTPLTASEVVDSFNVNQNGARRLYAYTEDYNLPSQNLCKKLGMRQEGLFMEFVSFVNDAEGNPIYENTMQWAILKKEWGKND